jgi:protein-L-isoaspartate(D-aspartate) O-methyltransferase
MPKNETDKESSGDLQSGPDSGRQQTKEAHGKDDKPMTSSPRAEGESSGGKLRVEDLLKSRGLGDLKEARSLLVDYLRGRGYRKDVVDAFEIVPRHAFSGASTIHLAYLDSYLWTDDTVLSTPSVVAYMIQNLDLTPEKRVLEVGSGTGFQTALLSTLVEAGHVFSIDRSPECIAKAREAIQLLGCQNVSLKVGDGYGGWPDQAPFDAIIVSASAPYVPDTLTAQLNPQHGRIVIPIGPAGGGQRLCLIRRVGDRLRTTDLGPTYFVPMVPSGQWAYAGSGVGAYTRPATWVGYNMFSPLLMNEGA